MKRTPPAAEKLLESSAKQWNSCGTSPSRTLLRLSILRELLRSLHAQRSVHLAAGQSNDARTVSELEDQVEKAREFAALESGNLHEALETALRISETMSASARILPEEVFNRIDRAKLVRYDRIWEAALAAEAFRLGWEFWTLESWVEIQAAETGHRELAQRLWPHGIVLFAENAALPPAPTQSSSGPPSAQSSAGITLQAGLWRGRWYVLREPGQPSWPELRLPQSIAGFSEQPELPAWKKLH